MEKVEKDHFLVAIVPFDTVMHQNLTPMKFWRSRSFVDLGQSSHVSCLVNIFKGIVPETPGPISLKFHMQPPSKGGKKIYIFCPDHRTKMGTMTIYGRNLKKSSSPEPLG